MSGAGFNPDVTLDALLQRNALTRPNATAICESNGKRYTYAEANGASAHLTAQIAAMSLPPASTIVLLLPNGSELLFSLFAVLRAGHIPVAMPVAWRKSDLVRACREAEAIALITTANYSAENLPQLATEVAIEVFELSFPCAFGSSLPDGIIPLTLEIGVSAKPGVISAAASASRGIGTMQPENGSVSLVLHSDGEMLAAGLGAMLASDIQSGDTIISAISFSSYAGLASALVPWLLSAGTLTLLSDASSNAPSAVNRIHLIATAGALWPLFHQLGNTLASATAVHFAGVHPNASFVAMQAEQIVDLYALRELSTVAVRRENFSTAQPIPLGTIHAGKPGASVPAVAETKLSEAGTVLVHGAMVPQDKIAARDWLDTGLAADLSGAHAFHVRHSTEMISIGALRFCFPELERRILSATLVSRIEVMDDRILGHRLVIESERPEQTVRELLDAGLPRVIANAVRKSDAQRIRA